MILQFDKYQGLGNDFVLIDGVGTELFDPPLPEAVKRLCDRRFGVGGDGILLAATPLSGGAVRMVYYNADGSFAETCFNGLRCMALHAVRSGRVRAGEKFVIESSSGSVNAIVDLNTGLASTELAGPTFIPSKVPVESLNEVIEADLEFSFGKLQGTALSIGNPHFVTWRERTLLSELQKESEEVGGIVEKSSHFPRATNFEIASIESPHSVRMAVWERGVGPTLACGSGATATVCAGVRSGKLPANVPVKVTMPGGELSIEVTGDFSRVKVVGGAEYVFSGEIYSRLLNLDGHRDG